MLLLVHHHLVLVSQRPSAFAQPPLSSSLTISSISSLASSSISISSSTFPLQHQSSSLFSSPKTSTSSLISCKSTSSKICHSSATFSSQPNCPSSFISSRLNEQSNFSVGNSIKSTSFSFKSSLLKILYFNTRSLLPKLDYLALYVSLPFLIFFVFLSSGCLLTLLIMRSQYLNYCCVCKDRSCHGVE